MMTQQLWYVRKQREVTGPFPSPQLRQAHELGLLGDGDEISLDGQNWISLADAGLLEAARPGSDDTEGAWRREREKARLRWLNDAAETAGGLNEEGGPDDMANRLRRHEDDTRTMVSARSARRPAVLAGLLAILSVVGVGVGVWLGQSAEPGISASLAKKASECSRPATEGVSWAGCNRVEANLANSNLRNAELSRTNFERADLVSADLSYANLEAANLRGANLRGAHLKGAALARSDLTGADLRDADLSFAVLSGAVLDGARLDGARLSRSTMPDGTLCAEVSVGECR